jgi:pilus assembly protein CpaB
MFSRFLIVGLASLALACGIALVCYKFLGARQDQVVVKTRSVVVAADELPAGARIRSQDLRMVSVPTDLAPQNSFDKIDQVRDRVVMATVMKDEPVAPSRLAAPGSAPGLAPMIPAGYRAVSVRVNDVIGVAGFIQPGMRVDVLASGHLPNSEDSVTRTVLQNVVVLSAGQVLQPEPKGQVINAQVVTLQVRPDEAEILTLTSGEGKIQLVLRNSSDTAVASTPGAHLTALYSSGGNINTPTSPAIRRAEKQVAPAKPVLILPPAPPPPPRTVEVIRGTSRSDVPLPRESSQKATELKKITRRLYAPYSLA